MMDYNTFWTNFVNHPRSHAFLRRHEGCTAEGMRSSPKFQIKTNIDKIKFCCRIHKKDEQVSIELLFDHWAGKDSNHDKIRALNEFRADINAQFESELLWIDNDGSEQKRCKMVYVIENAQFDNNENRVNIYELMIDALEIFETIFETYKSRLS